MESEHCPIQFPYRHNGYMNVSHRSIARWKCDRSCVRNLSMEPGKELTSVQISSFLLSIPRRNILHVVNRAGIHNHSPAAIANRGPSRLLRIREKLQMELPVSLLFLLAELTLIKDSLESVSSSRPGPAPSNQNCAAVFSFACLLTNQRGSITTNQDTQSGCAL